MHALSPPFPPPPPPPSPPPPSSFLAVLALGSIWPRKSSSHGLKACQCYPEWVCAFSRKCCAWSIISIFILLHYSGVQKSICALKCLCFPFLIEYCLELHIILLTNINWIYEFHNLLAFDVSPFCFKSSTQADMKKTWWSVYKEN